MVKKVLVEVEESTWKWLRAQALEEMRPVKQVVEDAFRLYLEMPKASSPTRGSVTGAECGAGGRPTADELRDLVNQVKPGSVITGRELMGGPKTGQQVAREREARRADYEGESQDPRDYGDDPGF